MGYLDIKNRESIDGVLCDTLSSLYHTEVEISKQYADNDFILNPRLNSAVFSRASAEVMKFVYRGHAVRRNIALWAAMNAYITIAFSKRGWFDCKYIRFQQLPECSDRILIMPGNMKVKVFDFQNKIITSIMKEGFEKQYYQNEIEVRMNPAWDFILPLTIISDNVYQEELLSGCTMDRLKKDKKAEAERKVRDILAAIQTKKRSEVPSTIYAGELLEKIHGLLTIVQADEDSKNNLKDFASRVCGMVTEYPAVIAFSHGDMQYGNIFFDDKGMAYVLDWESKAQRSIGYDLLTFYYKMRYRRNFLDRIDTFIADTKWTDISKTFYGAVADKKAVFSVYLLEDLIWALQECNNTDEKRVSENVLLYANPQIQHKLFTVLKEGRP